MTRRLWVTNDLPPQSGGIESFVAELITRGPGGQTVVIGPDHGDTSGNATWDTACGATVLRPRRLILPTRARTRHVIQTIRQHEIEVVVFGAAMPLARMAPKLRKQTGVATVALTHGHEAGMLSGVGRALGLARLVRTSLAGPDVICTISDYAENILHRVAPDVTYRRIAPGVDSQRFAHDAHARQAVRRAWGVDGSDVVIGCVSRLVPRKGQDTLIDVMSGLGANVHLVIAGAGPAEKALARRAAASPAKDRIHMIGRVPEKDLAATFHGFDIFAMPARTRAGGMDVEGLGIVYLEAQAAGLPTITGLSGGARETILDGQTGTSVDGTDPSAVRFVLAQLAHDPVLRAAWGQAAAAHIAATWEWDSIVTDFEALLTDVARSRAAAGVPS